MDMNGSKRQAIIAAVVLVAGAVAWVLGIEGAKMEGSPGFFGVGPLIADVNLILEVLLVTGLTYGFVLARRGNIEAHQINQTTWVVINLALIAFVMASSLQDVKAAKPSDFSQARIGVTWLHAAVGVLTALCGVWLMLQMNNVLPARWHLRGWENLMRAALAGYWLTALLGFVTYYLWYVR